MFHVLNRGVGRMQIFQHDLSKFVQRMAKSGMPCGRDLFSVPRIGDGEVCITVPGACVARC